MYSVFIKKYLENSVLINNPAHVEQESVAISDSSWYDYIN